MIYLKGEMYSCAGKHRKVPWNTKEDSSEDNNEGYLRDKKEIKVNR